MGRINSSVTIKISMAILVGLVGGVWIWMSREVNRPTQAKFFTEAAVASGIDFRMSFLPDEQGEKFKINLYDHGCGVAIGDYDGDGFDDIYFVNQLGKNALYHNKGDGTFEDRTAEAGVGLGDRICVTAVFGDYDNDGRQDLFVTSVRGGNVLFRNEGNGTFENVTMDAGLHHVGHCQGAHFFDFDNDGHLDLLVTCSANWTLPDRDPKQKYYPGRSTYFELIECEVEHNIFYRSNGNGTFTDVTTRAGLSGLGWASDAAIFDYDGDGRLDIVITNMFGRTQLFRNQGQGTFADVTRDVLRKTSWGAMGGHALDFNNDGKLDLFMVDMHSDMWLPPDADFSVIQANRKNRYATGPFDIGHPRFAHLIVDERRFADAVKLRYDEVVFGNTFFKNLGNGEFTEISDSANLETWWPWGVAVGDFDNDDYEDLFIPAGMGHPFGYWPNSLMMNNGKERFTDHAENFGIEPPSSGIYLEERFGTKRAARSSRAAAVADFDRNGRLDIIVSNFNDRPSYFRNSGAKGHYVSFRLTGTKSNRDAIGAVVRLFTGDQIMTRQVNSACGYVAQSSKVLHFGLGKHAAIDSVEITWPSGERQIISLPGINRLHAVTEPRN